MKNSRTHHFISCMRRRQKQKATNENVCLIFSTMAMRNERFSICRFSSSSVFIRTISSCSKVFSFSCKSSRRIAKSWHDFGNLVFSPCSSSVEIPSSFKSTLNLIFPSPLCIWMEMLVQFRMKKHGGSQKTFKLRRIHKSH